MVSKKEIEEKLSKVMDPELGLNIVEMGLIYSIDIKRKQKGKMQKVFIKMTFTTPACPLMNEILEQIKNELDAFKDLDIELNVAFDPPWSPERMSKKAKLRLGFL